MGRKTWQIAALSVLVLTATATVALCGPTSYVCTITDYTASGQESSRLQADSVVGSTLAIDRRSGAIIHPVLGNTDYSYVRVLNPGSYDWAFKVIADSGDGGNVIYLEVQEFSSEPRKPMAAVKSGFAYSGYCE